MNKENYLISDEDLKNVTEQLLNTDWHKVQLGRTKNIDYNYRFDLFVRKRSVKEVINTSKNGDISKISPMKKCLDTVNSSTQEMVSENTIGIYSNTLTPNCNLPKLSSFDDFETLSKLKSNEDTLLIGYDSEWYTDDENNRSIISWQFSVIVDCFLIELVFIRKLSKYLLSLELALGFILDYLYNNSFLSFPSTDVRNIKKYNALVTAKSDEDKIVERSFSTHNEALEHSVALYDDGKKVHYYNDWKSAEHLSVTLVCHAGKVDLSAFDQSSGHSRDFLKYCSEIHNGIVNDKGFRIYPDSYIDKYIHHNHKYAIHLFFNDTICHAPAKKSKLKDLGNAIGYHKIELNNDEIKHMDVLFQSDPSLYMKYAATDSTITLLYSSAFYGYNKRPPITYTSAACKVIKSCLMEYFKCKSEDEFNRIFRGLSMTSEKKYISDSCFKNVSKLDAISRDADIIQRDASQAYHGGYNSSSFIGYIPIETIDYDLQNAYPTAMSLVYDIDWSNPFLEVPISDCELNLDYFEHDGVVDPFLNIFAYVSFEFPENVKYPCIPIVKDGVPVFPRKTRVGEKVYACGPELFLALKLGAKIFVHACYKLRPLLIDGEVSYSMRNALKTLVMERKKAQKLCSKGSLEELILKDIANSACYGKICQNVSEKRYWDAYSDEMHDTNVSEITNPVIAAMTTSITRALLIAAQNQCDSNGYTCYSVTTDGFISNCPENVLFALDLFGFSPLVQHVRNILTDGADDSIWSVKHKQDDLVNLTTRGNVSLYLKDEHPYVSDGEIYGGVCAHNSIKSPYESDSFADRKWLMEAALNRTGPISYQKDEWTSFKDMVKNHADFKVTPRIVKVKMDFDLKRKPIPQSFYTEHPVIDNKTYEIACFDTEPYETVDEFMKYRKNKDKVTVLRTENDWKIFFEKLGGNKTDDWNILWCCILGHRCGKWNIPALSLLKGKKRLDWINQHNQSQKGFTENDWKNSGRKDRQKNILPEEYLMEFLNELMKDVPNV